VEEIAAAPRQHARSRREGSGYRDCIRAGVWPVLRGAGFWKPEIGKQWYVVYRDLSREKRLTKTMERIEHDYALPEWDMKKTITDLPGLYTR